MIDLENFTYDTVLLTATTRLADKYSEDYAKHQQANGQYVWPTPQIFSFHTWLKNTWQHLQLQQKIPSQLLSQEQVTYLFDHLTKTHAQEIMHTTKLAKKIYQAWQLCTLYQIPLDEQNRDPLFNYHQDSYCFIQISQAFDALCEQNNWITPTQLPLKIASTILQKRQAFRSSYVLAGFDEIPQALYIILQALDQAGIAWHKIERMESHHKNTPQAPISCLIANDLQDELYTMARWAKTNISQHEQQTIACIIPNLTDIREQVTRVFTEVFHPEYLQTGEYPVQPIFNISSGERMTHYAIVRDALDMLKLINSELSVLESAALLPSPYFESGNVYYTYFARHELATYCREHLQGTIDLASLIALTKKKRTRSQKAYDEDLAKRLAQIQAAQQPHQGETQKMPPSYFANHFLQQLQILGWPSSRNLNSQEHQCQQAFLETIKTLMAMDNIIPHLSAQAALQVLIQLCENKIFQFKSGKPRVHILGILEAAGLQFDAAWIMGMYDNQWPPSATPNPFIPVTLQKKYHMPHSSAQRELQFCQHVNKRLCTLAPDLYLSYPRMQGESVFALSPLWASYDLKYIDKTALNLQTWQMPYLHHMQSAQYEVLSDEKAPPLLSYQNIQGGSAILKRQAACPFQAFASIRLKAKKLVHRSLGLNPLERGQLTHQILELLWQHLQTQANLLAQDTPSLTALIKKTTHRVLQDWQKTHPYMARSYYFDIEEKRLLRLMLRWLTYEKKRPDFRVIAREARYTCHLKRFKINLSMDRIDELADGSYALIDYKTNLPSIQYWLGPRPDDPQLPLYALTSQYKSKISAIAFATLRSDVVSFKGISATTKQLPDTKTADFVLKQDKAWPLLLAEWQTHLTQLVDAFADGDARVLPKYGKQTCQYCDLSAFCRVQDKVEEPT